MTSYSDATVSIYNVKPRAKMALRPLYDVYTSLLVTASIDADAGFGVHELGTGLQMEDHIFWGLRFFKRRLVT